MVGGSGKVCWILRIKESLGDSLDLTASVLCNGNISLLTAVGVCCMGRVKVKHKY